MAPAFAGRPTKFERELLAILARTEDDRPKAEELSNCGCRSSSSAPGAAAIKYLMEQVERATSVSTFAQVV
jgi:hypothetical protein